MAFSKSNREYLRALKICGTEGDEEMRDKQGVIDTKKILLCVLLALVAVVSLVFHFALVALLLLLGLGAVHYLQRSHQAQRVTLAFEKDYPTFLLALASSVRTGLDSLQALRSIQEMFPRESVLRGELRLLCEDLESGKSEQEAILGFAKTIGHPDVKLFTTALLLSRNHGASIGGCLQRLTRSVRHRQSFRRKSRAAIATQRLSAMGIGGCSLLIGGMQLAMNSKAIASAWAHPLGSKLLAGGVILLGTGLLWMFQLGRCRV